jgi:hypothetical protein
MAAAAGTGPAEPAESAAVQPAESPAVQPPEPAEVQPPEAGRPTVQVAVVPPVSPSIVQDCLWKLFHASSANPSAFATTLIVEQIHALL